MLEQGLFLVEQVLDFLGSDTGVDPGELTEAEDLGVELGRHLALGLGDQVREVLVDDVFRFLDQEREDPFPDLGSAHMGVGVAGPDHTGEGFAVDERAGVVALGIDQDAQGCGWQETIDVKGRWGDAFEEEDGFEVEPGALAVGPEAEAGVSLVDAEDQVECAGDQRVIPGQELDVFTGEGAGAIAGDGQAFERKAGEGLGENARGTESPGACRDLLDVDVEVIEHGDHEGIERGIGILFADLVDDAGGQLWSERVQFEKTVASLFETGGEFESGGAGLGDEGGEVGLGGLGAFVEFGGHGGDAWAETFEQCASALEVFFEGVQAFVIPADEELLGAANDERKVQLDLGCLANAVESTDALFEQFGVEGEIEHHEVMGELEVATFAADLGTDEETGTVLLGEPCGVAVALDEGEAFVKDGEFGAGPGAEFAFEGLGLGPGAAQDEDLFASKGAELFEQPLHPGIGGKVGFEMRRQARVGIGGELFREALEEFDVVAVFVEGPETGDAAGKTGDGQARVAEHDATGAVLVEEGVEQGVADGVVGELGEAGLECGGRFDEETGEGGDFGSFEGFLCDHLFRETRNFAVAL